MKIIFEKLTLLLGILLTVFCCNQKINATEDSNYQNKRTSEKILVIYYSKTGTTSKVGEQIKNILEQENRKVDVLEIQEKEKYNNEIIGEQVREQIKKGIFPEVNSVNVDFNDYDTIIIGTPTWSGNPARPLGGYLNIQNFKNKKVSVYTVADADPGTTIKMTESFIKNASIIKGIEFLSKDVRSEKNIIRLREWLKTIIQY